jgi:hypothetical protein
MAGDTSSTLVIAAVVLVALSLGAWTLLSHRKQKQARIELLDRVGFRPCPEETGALEAIVRRIVNDRDHSYSVEEPRRLAGEPPVYYYVKLRSGHSRDERDAGEELLFRSRRPSKAAAVLFVKPSSIAPGVATRLVGAVATGPWTTQPDDLQRLELPPDLKDTNLLAALGPPGASLYDLVDAKLLSMVQGLGDAGAMIVWLRDEWCALEAGHYLRPFKVDELVARVRPLL